MSMTLRGAPEIYNAHEAGLTPGVGLVLLEEAAGQAALTALSELDQLEDYNERTRRHQEILNNEMPRLAEAGMMVAQETQAHLPAHLRARPGLEAVSYVRKRGMVFHFDDWAATDPLTDPRLRHLSPFLPPKSMAFAYGPLATSLGLAGVARIHGLQFFRKLDAQELTTGLSPTLDAFRDMIRSVWGEADIPHDVVTQNPGDLVLIPGAPQPTYHGIEVADDAERMAITGSYVITGEDVTDFDEMRRQDFEWRMLALRINRILEDARTPEDLPPRLYA